MHQVTITCKLLVVYWQHRFLETLIMHLYLFLRVKNEKSFLIIAIVLLNVVNVIQLRLIQQIV